MIDRKRTVYGFLACAASFSIATLSPDGGVVRTALAADLSALLPDSNKKERKHQRENHNVQADRATVVEKGEFEPVVIQTGAGVEVRSTNCVAKPHVCVNRQPVTAGSSIIVEHGAIKPFAVITGYVGGVVSTTTHSDGAEAALNYYESQGGIGPDPLIIGVGGGYIKNTSTLTGNDPIRSAIQELNPGLVEGN